MTNIFSDEKYQEAAGKCYDFIKRQMNVNNFKYNIDFAKRYSDSYEGDLVWGTVDGLSADEDQEFPKYIGVDEYHDYSYKGKITGTWHDLSDYKDYAVVVYVIQDTAYKVITCPLKADGTWETTLTYRETYQQSDGSTKESTYEIDYEIGEGIKEYRLAKGLTSTWERISEATGMITDRQIYSAATELSVEEGGRAYSRFQYFKVRLYSYSDAEYLCAECPIWNAGNGIFFWYTSIVYEGHKIGKVVQQVWRDGKFEYDVVGISGAIQNLKSGRLPASFLIPTNDPQYNKDGTNANGAYGYLLNSRTWAYDVGLALLVFTTSKDYDLCKEMLNRMSYEQNSDGSFNFSYDIYIGQLFDGYVRTGAMGWLVWGACYYTLMSGDRSYIQMIKKAGNYFVNNQIKDKTDPRYGLLTGGYGSYNMADYSYSGDEIEWCSVEHQCSALQGMEGCALVLSDKKYKEAAELIRDQLIIKCYDKENGRFFQGVNGGKPDPAWALDCTTWAGMQAFSIVNKDTAIRCFHTASEVYQTSGRPIVQSTEKDYFNETYSSDEMFSGFKPYSDKTADYAGAPDIVWTEGTLGYAALALMLGDESEAKKYVDECIRLQNCNGCTGGIIYTTATYGMLPWEFHVWESVVSSSWLYLIIKNPDVLFPRTLRQVYYMTKITNFQDERPRDETRL